MNNNKKIPKTNSIQELANFWDSHDLTDFEDQLEEIKEPVFERETVLNISFKPKEAEAVSQIATSRGITYAELVKEWVLEKIHVIR